jgi:hypothetical protein
MEAAFVQLRVTPTLKAEVMDMTELVSKSGAARHAGSSFSGAETATSPPMRIITLGG